MASRAEWTRRVERWRASGLTAGEFAEREGLSERSLAWWKWKLKSAPASMASAFLPVHVIGAKATPAAAEELFEIALPSGVIVRVPASFDATALDRILAVVERRGS